jgi:hypothetical protein
LTIYFSWYNPYEEASVEIMGGVCEAAHECRIKHCKFYDVTEAGDARFIVTLRRSQTLEGHLQEHMPQ